MHESKWEIKIVRTTMGDLIGEVDVNAPYGPMLTIRKPHQIRLQQQGQERVGLAFMPFMIYSDDTDYIVDRVHVVTVANPAEDLANAYRQQFGSGIIMPPTGAVVGDKILLKG